MTDDEIDRVAQRVHELSQGRLEALIDAYVKRQKVSHPCIRLQLDGPCGQTLHQGYTLQEACQQAVNWLETSGAFRQ